MNQVQATAMNEGVRRKKTLWSKAGRQQLESLRLAPWATRRRQDLLELVDRLNGTISELTAAIEQEARQRPEVLRLMTHPGVGPITALAFVLTIGSPDRFACGKKIGSYLGVIPEEDSSANRQRLGHITKQGNSLVRYLLTEAAQAAVRWDPDWRRRYVHLARRRERAIAKVAMARRLAVSLYWMWRKGYDYQQHLKFGSHAGQLEIGHGVQ
jgi:transposase